MRARKVATWTPRKNPLLKINRSTLAAPVPNSGLWVMIACGVMAHALIGLPGITPIKPHPAC
jgi:hypothetical protein